MPDAHRARAAWLALGLVIGLTACEKSGGSGDSGSSGKNPAPPASAAPTLQPSPPDVAAHFAAAQSAAAKSFTESMLLRLTDPAQPGFTATEAVSWLAAALHTHPDSLPLQRRLHDWLTGGVWHVPVLKLPHSMPLDLVDAAGTDSLWVAVAGDTHAVLRWDLTTKTIAAISFPIPQARTEFWRRDPSGRRFVLGRAGNRVLFDAISLKPVCSLPDSTGGEALTAFSADGLLLAHPAHSNPRKQNPDTADALHWLIRDAATGLVVREMTPDLPPGRKPLAVKIDRKSLLVRLDDGSAWSLPVSPVEPPSLSPPDALASGSWLAAWFPGSGPLAANGWCGLRSRGDHPPAEWLESLAGRTAPWVPDPRLLLAESPWSRRECLWNGPPQGNGPLQLLVRGSFAWPNSSSAPLQADADITALTTLNPGGWITASDDGSVLVHQILPALPKSSRETAPSLDAANANQNLAALDALVCWLGGGRPDPQSGSVRFSTIPERANSDWPQHLSALEAWFPGTDFTLWAKAHATMAHMQPAADALAPLQQRLARMRPPADPTAFDSIALAFSQGHENLSAVPDVIRSSGGSGAAAAMALKLSLVSDRPDWIRACLAQAVGLPATLARLAESRASWLEGNQAAAFESWPDPLPDLASVRRQEDWDGWEQVDFAPEYEAFRQLYQQECAKLCLPPGTDAAGWLALAERLTDPATAKTFGNIRVAQACLAAATTAPHGVAADVATRLVNTAETLGADRPACLRAAALALTAAGNYREARDRWVELISLHPVRSHQPGDYAEAAYTAFENSDPRQAMAILATGMHRFSDDARFALRAGWVALLTGNPQPAYRFLLAGHRSGFPPEVRENATALLAVAAFQSGAPEDAAAFFQDLIALSPDWNQAATIDSLSWPTELKAALKSAAGW